MNFLKSIAEKLNLKSKPQNKHPIPKLKDAGKILIDESVLYCPICYEVYSQVPLILRCGHTFCESCISRMAGERLMQAQSVNGTRIMNCPMCREASPVERVTRNFLVEDLILGISAALDDPLEENQKTTLTNLKFMNKRLENRCRELSKDLDTTKEELNSAKERENHGYICFFVLVGAIFIYRAVFGAS